VLLDEALFLLFYEIGQFLAVYIVNLDDTHFCFREYPSLLGIALGRQRNDPSRFRLSAGRLDDNCPARKCSAGESGSPGNYLESQEYSL
jgi:hypothetical protein